MSTQSLNQDVLIVDDDPDMRDILNTALSGLGYNTFLAEDGDVALRLFNEHRPHLVVSDIFMPRFDGLRANRAYSPKAIVIPRWATPSVVPRCFFLYFTLFGLSMAY